MYKLGSGYVVKGLFYAAENKKKAVRTKEKILSEQKSVKVLGSKTGKTDGRKRKLQQTANNGDEKQTYK